MMNWARPTYSCAPLQPVDTVGSNAASAYKAREIFDPYSLGWASSFLRAFYFLRASSEHPVFEEGPGVAQYSPLQHVSQLSLCELLFHMGLHPLLRSTFPSLHQLQFYLSLQSNQK